MSSYGFSTSQPKHLWIPAFQPPNQTHMNSYGLFNQPTQTNCMGPPAFASPQTILQWCCCTPRTPITRHNLTHNHHKHHHIHRFFHFRTSGQQFWSGCWCVRLWYFTPTNTWLMIITCITITSSERPFSGVQAQRCCCFPHRIAGRFSNTARPQVMPKWLLALM